MTDCVFADVSYYQAPVDDTYPHRWLSFRACDGTFHDPNFTKNRIWANQACRTGKMAGYTIYAVYRPGIDLTAQVKALVGPPSKYMTVMVDVESWGGQITGDHSADITATVKALAKWLGSRDRVLAYGNVYDLANLYPHRPDWLHMVVASYGTQQPASVPNMIAWQYYGGGDTPTPDGLPRSSAPFGVCDHNIAPGLSAEELATALGVGPNQGDSVSNSSVLRAFARGGKYATAKLRKAFPVLARKKGILARIDRLEQGELSIDKAINDVVTRVNALEKK